MLVAMVVMTTMMMRIIADVSIGLLSGRLRIEIRFCGCLFSVGEGKLVIRVHACMEGGTAVGGRVVKIIWLREGEGKGKERKGN